MHVMHFSDRIFVTGGAGFLGRALIRFNRDVDWTVYSRDEHKLRAVEGLYGVHTISGDIQDVDRLRMAMRGHRYVIHAAASKYVDRGEVEPEEVVRANVVGTMNVLNAAIEAGVDRLVFISTDKAVEARNAYGMSKALGERLALRAASSMEVVVCRYGNVLRSTGSVVDKWMSQTDGTPTKITNPDMTRFWMTVDQAAELVHWGLVDAPAGCIVVPVLKAATIMTLAHACVGAKNITIVGERLGEKVHEVLLSEEETPYAYKILGHDLYILRPPHTPTTVIGCEISDGFLRSSTPVEPHRSDTAEQWTAADLAQVVREPLP